MTRTMQIRETIFVNATDALRMTYSPNYGKKLVLLTNECHTGRSEVWL